ncbi:hypothetical protein K505DRAFT_327999 [Melanomma pulvis-pyrius CBS 109.77]|uniref:Uncharacterized protein n=1 Tax=Melanomma pulvis-pyrius CBS 109.77 TaxID=1314802 RepID=A0A6A6X0W7_9PLEO|nr:hypothetical protein K505DRAFT_327999 [Melanomma pulvis-pyrius CBS 109.77]
MAAQLVYSHTTTHRASRIVFVMPAPTPCPVPEVDRTLSPYINSRQDTLRIRRTLSKYLTANLRPVNPATQAQHLNHECPLDYSAVNVKPPGIKQTRLNYLLALQARLQAQMRHRELQASLEELQNRHVTEAPAQSDSAYDNEVTRGYISLLRQRRRFGELQVVQDSLEKLLNANPSNQHKEPKVLVQASIGEQPGLPAERLDLLAQGQDDESWVFKLKKEVLQAKANMDRANSTRVESQTDHRAIASLQQQVHALSCARDEMVEWVEGELAKMNEESEFLEDASPMKKSTGGSPLLEMASAEAQVRMFYNKYTTSRSALVDAHESIQRPATASTPALGASNDHAHVISQSTTPNSTRAIARILPYLSYLAQIAGNERSLLQQAVYLQSQLSSADEEITESLSRLSGESHLIPSGSKGITAWGKIAKQVEAATEEFVKAQLQESRLEINSINTIVDLCSLQSKVLSST